jgi:hypothetical protein
MNRDDQEKVDAERGYRTAGARELSLRDWMALQGDPEEPAPTPKAFKRLTDRLRAKNWYHDHKGDEGYEARRQRNNASGRTWTKANRKLCNQRQNKRRRAAWRARASAGIKCADCRVWFCEARPRKGPKRLFCGRACQNRYNTRMWQRRASLRRGAKQRRKKRP